MAKPTTGNIELIGAISQKNGGTFPIAYGEDIEVDGKRLPDALKELREAATVETATNQEVDALFT